jgi:PAS domain S-box-containing protein
MPPLPDHVLIARVAAALSGANAEHSLEQVLATLRSFGFVAHSEAAGTPWLEVNASGRAVALTVAAEPADPALRDTLAHLISAALSRAAECDELRQARERMEMLHAASFEGILIHEDGVILDANQRFAEIVGYERSEVLSKNALLLFVAPEDTAAVAQRMQERFEGTYLVNCVRKDGSRFRAELQSKQCKIGMRSVRVVAARDVTERERLSKLLHESDMRLRDLAAQTQRLESLGVLASGVAHDFNNLLVGVLGNADLLQSSLAQAGDRELCADIIDAARRASDLTAQLLAYAGQPARGRRKPVDLGTLWREVSVELEGRVSEHAELELRLGPGSVVSGDSATLSQVLVQLVSNASDALAGQHGRIEVITSRVREPDARWDGALGTAVGPGDWVQIEVRDTGSGMDSSTLQRVFEPFFSTKGQGQGLGLAASLGIVAAHGGAVAAESEPGQGSRFSVLLPAARQGTSSPPRVAQRSAAGPRKILIIDDELVVRALLRRSLAQRGYTVSEAAGGHAGVEAIRSDTPDLVVLDMMMPDLDGAEVVRRVRAEGFTMPILIVSGHVDVATERRLPPGSFQGFLRKPFSVAELVTMLEAAYLSSLRTDS